MRDSPLYSIHDCRIHFNNSGTSLWIEALEVLPGDYLALQGPNGSGKTTLLKVLNGLLSPSSGEILFKGIPLSKNPELHRCTTYVHQAPYLFEGTVFRNIAFGLHSRRVSPSEIELRVKEALKCTGLEGFEHRNARKLSGGETYRVAIARALALQPEVLLLDEPTAQTDAESSQLIKATLKRIREDQHTTVIFATHDSDLAASLADRIVQMKIEKNV